MLFVISIGVLLGDAGIQQNKSVSSEKYRLKFLQGAKRKEYIFHFHSLFHEYVLSEPFLNQQRNTYSFQTVFHCEFKKLADIFLDTHNKKSIQDFFFKNTISPISLAYWFMDDGGLLAYNKDYIRKGLVLNTQGFTFHKVGIFSENLNNTYNLQTWVKQNKKKPVLAISGTQFHQVEKLIFPHIIFSVRYKFPM